MRNRSQAIVTGGAGFIGSELVTQLIADGHFVIVLDNLATGRRENLAHLPSDSLELIVGDVRDDGLLARLCREARTVFHLACLGVRHSLHAPVETHDVNAGGSLAVARAAHAAKVARLVHVSSSEVYGSAGCAPMTEEHPCAPATVYGAAKLAGEAYARTLHLSFGVPVVIIRPFNAYGPRCHHEGDSGEVIPKFILRAMAGEPLVVFGDGEQTRDFTHVSDIVRGIVLAATSSRAVGRTFNLGSGSEVSINALARNIALQLGIERPNLVYDHARPGDVRRLVAGCALARDTFGFAPRVKLERGLASLVDWYRRFDAASLLSDEVVRNWEVQQTCQV